MSEQVRLGRRLVFPTDFTFQEAVGILGHPLAMLVYKRGAGCGAQQGTGEYKIVGKGKGAGIWKLERIS